MTAFWPLIFAGALTAGTIAAVLIWLAVEAWWRPEAKYREAKYRGRDGRV